MKTRLFILMAVLVAGLASCKDTNEPEHVYTNTASHDIAGTYAGNWTILLGKDNTESTVPGTITFTEVDTAAYVATILVTVEGGEDRTDVCNVSHANDGFIFYNNTATTFGTKFSGRIDDNGNTTMQFTIEEKDGRKKYTNTYHFAGVSQK